MTDQLLMPAGAQHIWALRLSRRKPNEPVFLSTIGELHEGRFQVQAPQGHFKKYEWRWVRDLAVVVVVNNDTDAQRASSLCNAVIRHAPNGAYTSIKGADWGWLWVWNADKQDGYLLDWWRGRPGVPALRIAETPAQLNIRPMPAADVAVFSGVRAE